MRDQEFKLIPSKLYLVMMSMLLGSSALILLCLPISIWMKLAGMILLTIYAIVAMQRYAYLSSRQSIKAIQFDRTLKRWMVYTNADTYSTTLCGDSILTTWVMVLRFRLPNRWWPISCLIFKDSLTSQQFRELAILLRHGG